MLKRLFLNATATVAAVFAAIFADKIRDAFKNEAKVDARWHYYNDDADDDEDFNFGPTRDELVTRFILYMWETHHVCLSKAEVEQMLDEMDADGDEYIGANPHPVFLRKTRNDHIVVGHTMRPQTASRTAMRHSRQKIC